VYTWIRLGTRVQVDLRPAALGARQAAGNSSSRASEGITACTGPAVRNVLTVAEHSSRLEVEGAFGLVLFGGSCEPQAAALRWLFDCYPRRFVLDPFKSPFMIIHERGE
jgi:hypothetical protein